MGNKMVGGKEMDYLPIKIYEPYLNFKTIKLLFRL